MAGYSPVASGATIQKLYQAGVLSDYLLVVAPQVFAHPEQYEWLSDWSGTLIMDNGVIELGASMAFDKVVQAANFVQTSWVVLPDVLYDNIATLVLAKENISRFKGYQRFVGVIQGTTPDQLHMCASDLVKMGVSMLALPRCLADSGVISRKALAEWCQEEFPRTPLTMFGFSNNMLADMEAAKVSGVVGIDSGTPIWLGRSGIDVRALTLAPLGHRPSDFWDRHDTPEQLLTNVQVINKWMSA